MGGADKRGTVGGSGRGGGGAAMSAREAHEIHPVAAAQHERESHGGQAVHGAAPRCRGQGPRASASRVAHREAEGSHERKG